MRAPKGEAPHYREELLAVSSLEHSTELVMMMIQLAHKRPSVNGANLHYDRRQ
jgi:hypothetical protein